MAIVRVAAAVILRPDGDVLLAQRPFGKPYEGYWEFPGGKLEPGETPREALDRELREELGLAVLDAAPWLVQRFAYPHADVELHFFRVFAWQGEPHGHDGQAFRWQTPGRFDVTPLLPANTVVLRSLLLPAVCGFANCAGSDDASLLARIERAFERGLRLLQLAPGDRPEEAVCALVAALQARAAPFGARLQLAGDAARARAWGCAGVFWSADELAAATSRPAGLLCSAACRNAADLARAASMGLDFAVLGPVRAAAPDGPALGWAGFRAAVADNALPVFATGGLNGNDIGAAVRRGAHGVALPVGDR